VKEDGAIYGTADMSSLWYGLSCNRSLLSPMRPFSWWGIVATHSPPATCPHHSRGVANRRGHRGPGSPRRIGDPARTAEPSFASRG